MIVDFFWTLFFHCTLRHSFANQTVHAHLLTSARLISNHAIQMHDDTRRLPEPHSSVRSKNSTMPTKPLAIFPELYSLPCVILLILVSFDIFRITTVFLHCNHRIQHQPSSRTQISRHLPNCSGSLQHWCVGSRWNWVLKDFSR
jgi:hypothetical protein